MTASLQLNNCSVPEKINLLQLIQQNEKSTQILFPILKEGGVLSMVFCAVLKQFLSSIFLAMAKVSLWASKFSIQESGSPKNHCIGSNSW